MKIKLVRKNNKIAPKFYRALRIPNQTETFFSELKKSFSDEIHKTTMTIIPAEINAFKHPGNKKLLNSDIKV